MSEAKEKLTLSVAKAVAAAIESFEAKALENGTKWNGALWGKGEQSKVIRVLACDTMKEVVAAMAKQNPPVKVELPESFLAAWNLAFMNKCADQSSIFETANFKKRLAEEGTITVNEKAKRQEYA